MVEFSPIDCTAAAVVTLGGADSGFTVFHATNGHRVQMGDVIEAMNQVGIPVKIVSEQAFTETFNKALADEKRSEYVSPLISYQASDKNTIEFFIDYDNAFTTKDKREVPQSAVVMQFNNFWLGNFSHTVDSYTLSTMFELILDIISHKLNSFYLVFFFHK